MDPKNRYNEVPVYVGIEFPASRYIRVLHFSQYLGGNISTLALYLDGVILEYLGLCNMKWKS